MRRGKWVQVVRCRLCGEDKARDDQENTVMDPTGESLRAMFMQSGEMKRPPLKKEKSAAKRKTVTRTVIDSICEITNFPNSRSGTRIQSDSHGHRPSHRKLYFQSGETRRIHHIGRINIYMYLN
jgi:hypothetical protein